MKTLLSKQTFAKLIIATFILQPMQIGLFAKTKRAKRSCEKGFEVTADYVIVGAGAGGSVLASRLAQAGFSVIVLEAGPDTSLESNDQLVQCDKLGIAVPLLLASGWNRFTQCATSTQCGNWNATQTLAEFVSVDQNGIYYTYPRGIGAGGSTAHHALQDGIGSLQVYDNIAHLIEDNYWLGSNIDRLFKKMERVNFPNPEGLCGTDGWLNIIHTPIEPLFTDYAASVESIISTPFRENFCNPQTPDGIGLSSIQVTPDLGRRSYAYQDLLLPTKEATGNIQVFFNTLAFEIILENNKKGCPNPYKARGVKAYNKAYLQEVQPGAAHTIICPNTSCPDSETCLALNTDQSLPKTATSYLARKEVIICGGAIQSPQLLMLSGIGPREHLASVGITPKVDLPGVGSDLLDHCETSVIFEINPEVWLPSWIAHLLLASYPNVALPEGPFNANVLARAQEAVAAYPQFLNQNTASLQWDWYSDSPVNPVVVPGEQYPFPDMHTVPYAFFYTGFDLTLTGPQYPGNWFNFNRNNLLPDILNPIDQKGLPIKKAVIDAQTTLNAEGKPRVYMTILIENLKPKVTNGTIRLASNDPRQSPIVREQLYEDDDSIERMAKMVFQVRNAAEKLREKYSIPGQPWEIFPGTVNPEMNTIGGVKQFIKNWQSYGHHMSGTCQMGARDKATGKAKNHRSVLDPRCRVFGVDRLRVADASVYVTPWLHAFNTTRAAYVVGEAVAEFIINKL